MRAGAIEADPFLFLPAWRSQLGGRSAAHFVTLVGMLPPPSGFPSNRNRLFITQPPWCGGSNRYRAPFAA